MHFRNAKIFIQCPKSAWAKRGKRSFGDGGDSGSDDDEGEGGSSGHLRGSVIALGVAIHTKRSNLEHDIHREEISPETFVLDYYSPDLDRTANYVVNPLEVF